jgi:hypothetical protein
VAATAAAKMRTIILRVQSFAHVRNGMHPARALFLALSYKTNPISCLFSPRDGLEKSTLKPGFALPIEAANPRQVQFSLDFEILSILLSLLLQTEKHLQGKRESRSDRNSSWSDESLWGGSRP